jgi:PPK2 family polyphosphate:nucleotide phosphotransferase
MMSRPTAGKKNRPKRPAAEPKAQPKPAAPADAAPGAARSGPKSLRGLAASLDRFRVKAAARLNLAQCDPEDKSALPGGKAERVEALETLGPRLDELQEILYAQHTHKLLVVLQGMDTAGKDGTIRRVFRTIDPLGVRVAAFKAPSPEELDHDYLWRVHRQVPGAGEIAIFNRSHYEDVLVTRVRGWVSKDECRRRYRQINDFEKMLAETGTTIVKFFLHISHEEQRKRLQERLDNPLKQWKFNSGDIAERALWPDYMSAYQDAIANTSTEHAPWYVVPANSNSHRDLVVAGVLVRTLESLGLRYPAPEENLDQVEIE